MKKTLTQILTAFAFAALLATPAAAADAPQSAAVQTPACASATLATANQPLEMQGSAAENVPNQGYACELPPQQVNEDCICPLVFDPVCGCNGETYSNACFASCEVRFFTEGACDA